MITSGQFMSKKCYELQFNRKTPTYTYQFQNSPKRRKKTTNQKIKHPRCTAETAKGFSTHCEKANVKWYLLNKMEYEIIKQNGIYPALSCQSQRVLEDKVSLNCFQLKNFKCDTFLKCSKE